MSVYIVNHDEIRNYMKLEKELSKNRFVIHLPDVAINYTIKGDDLVIVSETFDNRMINFTDPLDCELTREYAILAKIHGLKNVVTGRTVHTVVVTVNMPDGEYYHTKRDGVVELHSTRGSVFIHIEGVYLAVGDLEVMALYRRYIRTNIVDAIPDDYLVRIGTGDDSKYLKVRWCYKNHDLAMLMQPGTTPAEWVRARETLDGYFNHRLED